MLPIGPLVLCSIGGVSTRLAVSVLQCCVVWVDGGCLLWPQQVVDHGEAALDARLEVDGFAPFCYS